MAEIKETPTIAPVLPTGTRNNIRQEPRRPVQQREPGREQQRQQKQRPDDGHRVDEYA
jgi:hypothetical protein